MAKGRTAAEPEPNGDSLLDDAYAAMRRNDLETALKLVATHRLANPGDEDAQALEDLIFDVRSGKNPVAWEDDQDFQPEAPAYDPLSEFRCVRCGNRAHSAKRLMMNTRGLTFLGFDELNERAKCIHCRTCGFVHWFVHGSPSAFQAIRRDRSLGRVEHEEDRPGGCLVCGYDDLAVRDGLLNTRGLTFLGLEWLNRGSTILACVRCGYCHWYLRDTAEEIVGPREHLPPDPPWAAEQLGGVNECLACGGHDHEQRTALLTDRFLTFLGFDWLNEGATLRVCQSCGIIDWYGSKSSWPGR